MNLHADLDFWFEFVIYYSHYRSTGKLRKSNRDAPSIALGRSSRRRNGKRIAHLRGGVWRKFSKGIPFYFPAQT
jgi:hypothetical protein